MLRRWLKDNRTHKRLARRLEHSMDTDAAFMDSSNLPGFNMSQLEGRLVRSLTQREVWIIGALFIVCVCAALGRGYILQIDQQEHYSSLAEQNRFERSPIFAKRGVIQDRFGRTLAWNEPNILPDGTVELFPIRLYDSSPALAHILGYVREPRRDKKGNWWRTSYEAHGGIEGFYNEVLSGVNGDAIYEVDATGARVSFFAAEPAHDGLPVKLSVDAQLTKDLYDALAQGVRAGFIGGAGIIMDVHTGEIVAMTSYPSFDINEFAHPETTGADSKISKYLIDTHYPLLDRVYQGVYLPGSIVKPFVALAALEEGVITPEKGIVSTGKLVVPNPFNPDKPTIFKDWKAHGWVNMRDAIAVSSDVYFYEVGGGFEDQKGLGIQKLHAWMTRFGFGEKSGFIFEGEKAGIVPSPEWKEEAFATDTAWNIGNTYHSAIGQYGWLVTPLQSARALSILVNGGTRVIPTIVSSSESVTEGDLKNIEKITFADTSRTVVLEGMMAATKRGTARAINVSGIDIAGKTGTAEVGSSKEHMNSWVIGVWPAHKPVFAFAVVLEKAPANTLRGAAPAMKPFFEKLVASKSPYVRGQYPRAEDVVTHEDKKAEKQPLENPSVVTADVIPTPEVPAFIPDAPGITPQNTQ